MTRSRVCVACFTVVLATLLVAHDSPAQESRWTELDTRVSELYQQGKYTEALPLASQSLKVAEATFAPDDIKLVTAIYRLANLYEALGRYAEAEPLWERALRIQEKSLGPEHHDVGTDLNNLANLYDEEGKYAEAEPLLQRALRIYEKTDGPEDPETAVVLSSLASLYDDEGKYPQAEPLYQRALSINEKKFGPEDVRVAINLNNLGLLYDHEGKYPQAEPLFQRALGIDEKKLGPDNPGTATDINNLALVYYDQRRYAEAEPLYQRALHIREKALGPDSPDVASSLNNLGNLYNDLGKYAEAEPFFQRALSIDEKALGPDHPSLATDLDDLASLYYAEDKFADAELLYLRVLRIREKALGPDHPELAIALNNLALLYYDTGRYGEAETMYQRAMRIKEKALGPDHPSLANSLDNLGLLYYHEGKYADAEPLYRRALSIKEKALGPNDPDLSISLSNLALLYDAQGKYAEAEPLYQQSVRIQEKALGPDDTGLATSLNNLGTFYVTQGKDSEAEPLFQRALSIQEKALGPNHTGVAVALNNLAVLDVDQGKYAEAEPLYQRALHIDEKALGPDNTSVATALNNLGNLDTYQGKYAEAEPLDQRALNIDIKALGPDSPSLAGRLKDLGWLYESQGKYAEAESFYQRSLDNLFQQFQYSFTYMTEKERLGFLHTVAFDFPAYFSFVHRFEEKDPQLSGSMYNLLLWEKGFIVASIADTRRQVEASGDPEALKLLGQLTAKRTEISALQNARPKDRELWRKQIDQLQAEANEIEKALIMRSSVFAEQKKLERATWQQVRDALGPEDAAVEFVRFRFYDKKWTDTSYYAALVVTRESKDQPQYIFLGDRAQIEGEAAVRFQRAVQTRGSTRELDAKLPGAQAYELIWKPLEKALAGKTRIYLSPDGVLNELPLGIIPAPDGKLQMEKYDLRLLSSTRDILRSAPPRAAATALLVGDPVFDLTEDLQLAAMQKLTLPQKEKPVLMSALSPNDRSRDLGEDSTLPRLPGTGAEVSAIAQLMQERQWKTGVFTGELALKRVVEQANNPRVVHLATHGFFLPDQQLKTDRVSPTVTQFSGLEDPMLRSGLYFAGADRTLAGKPSTQGLDNGVLTAMEAGNLNLRGTELVVLSACNTGQGEVKNGEGVFGLRRALQEAGAQAVLMSLWSVPDKETLELMKRFYTKWLGGMEIHQALKEAQLEMREQVRLTHGGKDLPYYWGAFVLVGR
jgi:tetratricopeptide (TPR) repeat protein